MLQLPTFATHMALVKVDTFAQYIADLQAAVAGQILNLVLGNTFESCICTHENSLMCARVSCMTLHDRNIRWVERLAPGRYNRKPASCRGSSAYSQPVPAKDRLSGGAW